MRFAFPHMLWLLLLLPLLSIALLWALGVRQQLLNRFSTQKAQQRTAHRVSTSINWTRFSLILLSVLLLIVAMARPQWGYHEQRIISRGVDMIVAIDTSNSMLARDFQPNRLTRAKDLLRNLIWEAKGSRVGVIAFSGASVVLCPLTLDYDMASTALKAVDVNTVSTPGTNIGAALRTAASAFEISGANDRVLILLTDGEQTELVDQLNASINEVAEANIKVFAIGIGAENGVNIPTLAGPKRDSEGNVVTTALDFEKLQEIASKTQGKAIRAEKMGAGEIAEISAELAKFKGTKQDDRTVRIYHDRYPWFIGAAVLLLLIEAFISSARRFPFGRRAHSIGQTADKAAPLFIAIATLLILTQPHQILAYPAEDYVKARSAYQSYSAENYEDALDKYDEATGISPDNQLLQFNAGATAAHTSDTASAEQRLRTIYDPQNPVLNAKALFGAATLQHRKLRGEIKAKKPEWEGALNQPQEAVDTAKTELKEKIGNINSVLDDYREALLTYSPDVDFKTNYELAQRDRNELQQLLDQLEQQQEQPQQEQPEQEQDNEDEEKEDQPGEGEDQPGDQDKPNEDGEKEEDEQEKDNPGESDKQNSEDQSGEQSEGDDKEKPDSPPENDPGKSGEADNKPGEQTPQQTPQPTPSPTPGPQPGQGSKDQAPQPGEAPPVSIGQMSPTDVDRLLNTLPAEDQNALQLMFGPAPATDNGMKNDW